jgi:RNA polymerase sigma factor for flagellar operon FliA
VRRLQTQLGRKPTADEVMRDLGLEPLEFEELQRDLARLAVFSLSQTDESEDDSHSSPRSAALVDRRHPDPVEQIQKREATGVVFSALDPKERRILALYYFDGITMKEIGRRLGLSESRVCQIHGEALARLRTELAGRFDDFDA